MGGSYSWITGGCPLYEQYFLTTRNGIFFALPMLCVGELIATKRIQNLFWGLIISGLALFTEISVVQQYRLPDSDCSMYLMMPIFMYFFVCALMNIEVKAHTIPFRKASVATYVIQYGVITVVCKVFDMLGLSLKGEGWIIWILVIAAGWVIYVATEKIKWLRLVL